MIALKYLLLLGAQGEQVTKDEIDYARLSIWLLSIGQFPKESAIIRAFSKTCGALYTSGRSAPAALEYVSRAVAALNLAIYLDESERNISNRGTIADLNYQPAGCLFSSAYR